MTDPLGLIGSQAAQGGGGIKPVQPAPGAVNAQGESFKDLLMQNLQKVNSLQNDATKAIEDLNTGKRDDLETVLMATQKADTAFRMLQQVRNKLMDAYSELQQIRV
ncbi:flagellar hook-basal body complex protein FliE [Phycisphaerales bacterium ac7]|nr:flagellar hook-basal body complex protein FliE [bacterium]